LIACLIDQRGQMLPLEGEGGTFRVMLVVGAGLIGRLDNAAVLTFKSG